MHPHVQNAINNPTLVNDSTLHVVAVCSNPARYHSRYRLFRNFVEEMESTPNVALYVVEAAYGDRQHEVSTTGHPRHRQLRTNSEIWIKESMINIGVRDLVPYSAQYIAWIDADVTFRDKGWALETIHQLQHFPVVQPFQNALDLGPDGSVIQVFQSFGYLHQQGLPKIAKISDWDSDYKSYGHTGYGWAVTRAQWQATNGLIDYAILGAADHVMAWGYVGEVSKAIYNDSPDIGPSYCRLAREWQAKATRVSHNQIGFVNGRIEHHWHGSKKARGYQSRHSILFKHKFDPATDLHYDSQGLIQLNGNKPGLEHDLMLYNRSRQEDSIDKE